MKTKVLIADDHRLMLEALRRALGADGGIEVVGEAHGGKDVLPLVRHSRPDVVLLDVHMPDVDGLTCLRLIRRSFAAMPVLMLSASTDPAAIARAAECGARGYVAKTATPEELADALRKACSSGDFLTRGLAEGEPGSEAAAALTDRELVVLGAVVRGLSNRQIAGELWLSEQTVKFHLRNVYRKLGVSTRGDAVRAARLREIAPHE